MPGKKVAPEKEKKDKSDTFSEIFSDVIKNAVSRFAVGKRPKTHPELVKNNITESSSKKSTPSTVINYRKSTASSLGKITPIHSVRQDSNLLTTFESVNSTPIPKRKASEAKKRPRSGTKITPEERPRTYLQSQGDHTTPYGLIKSALDFYGNQFFAVNEQIDNVNRGLCFQDGLENLEESKQECRSNILNILSAVSALNQDSIFVNISEIEVAENLLSPSSKKRNTNLFGLGDEVDNVISKYDATMEKYNFLMTNINSVSFSTSTIDEEKFREGSKEAFLALSNQAKQELLKDIGEKALKLFNNIKGITYNSPEGYSVKEILKQQSKGGAGYFFDNFKQDGEEISSGAGDSVFVVRLLNLLKKDALSTGDIYGADKEKYATVFADSFFLPRITDNISNDEYDCSNAGIATRQNSRGELVNHMARHLFLIVSCFPFLKDKTFHKEERGNQQSNYQTRGVAKNASEDVSWNFDDLMQSFVSKHLTRYDVIDEEIVQDYCKRVRKSYENFSQKLEVNLINIDPTPNQKYTRSIPVFNLIDPIQSIGDLSDESDNYDQFSAITSGDNKTPTRNIASNSTVSKVSTGASTNSRLT